MLIWLLFFQDFLTQVFLHLENTNHPQLHEKFRKLLEKPPAINQHSMKTKKSKWALVKSKLPLFQQSIIEGIQCIPSQIDSLKVNCLEFRFIETLHNTANQRNLNFCANSAKLLRKLDHVLLWILSNNTRQLQCRAKKISMTSNVLPLHFAPIQACSSKNSNVDSYIFAVLWSWFF